MKQLDIYRALQKDIAAHRFAPDNKLPSESDLTARFQASRGTVRQALAQLQRDGLVEKRNGVGSFVTKRGVRKSGRIGLLIPDLAASEFFVGIHHAVEAASRRIGYGTVLETLEKTTPSRTADTARHIARKLLASRVEGVIFRPLIDERFAQSNQEIVRILKNAETPFVLLDTDITAPPKRSPFDLVAINNVRAGQVIAQHLVERGRTRIAFLMVGNRIGPNANWKSRLFGVAGELAVEGFETGVQTLSFPPDDLRALKALLRGKARPDAIVCGNDETAVELVRSLTSLGARIPDDIAVIGFDDAECARSSIPPLTTISQPVKLLARTALKTLFSRIRIPDGEAREILLDAPLVIRRST